jgi:hypothetical protein
VIVGSPNLDGSGRPPGSVRVFTINQANFAPLSIEVPAITITGGTVDKDNSFTLEFKNPISDPQSVIYAAVIHNTACTAENSSIDVNSNIPNVASGTRVW